MSAVSFAQNVAANWHMLVSAIAFVVLSGAIISPKGNDRHPNAN